MADLKLIKTDNIAKVPEIKANQLIFVDDGSMYFDFSNTLRLHNSGGARLENFVAGKEYLRDDMCVYNGIMYRAKVDCLDYTFVKNHWEMLLNTSGENVEDATAVLYDSSASGLSAATVQAAIDEVVVRLENTEKLEAQIDEIHNEIEDISNIMLTVGTEFELDTF